jgi:HEAT repeat protein
MWEYSTRTLEPEKIIAADPSSSRLQYAARLLSAMSCVEAIPNLFGLMEHPDHFVRWTAVQSILALDLQKGLEALALAEKDKHSHLRNAAAKALRLAANIDQSAVGSAA